MFNIFQDAGEVEKAFMRHRARHGDHPDREGIAPGGAGRELPEISGRHRIPQAAGRGGEGYPDNRLQYLSTVQLPVALPALRRLPARGAAAEDYRLPGSEFLPGYHPP